MKHPRWLLSNRSLTVQFNSSIIVKLYLSRYVCWSAYLLKDQKKLKALGLGERDSAAKLPLDKKLYLQYFVQDDADSGTLMDTKILNKEVIKP